MYGHHLCKGVELEVVPMYCRSIQLKAKDPISFNNFNYLSVYARYKKIKNITVGVIMAADVYYWSGEYL